MPKTFKIVPKWRNLAKSGHNAGNASLNRRLLQSGKGQLLLLQLPSASATECDDLLTIGVTNRTIIERRFHSTRNVKKFNLYSPQFFASF